MTHDPAAVFLRCLFWTIRNMAFVVSSSGCSNIVNELLQCFHGLEVVNASWAVVVSPGECVSLSDVECCRVLFKLRHSMPASNARAVSLDGRIYRLECETCEVGLYREHRNLISVLKIDIFNHSVARWTCHFILRPSGARTAPSWSELVFSSLKCVWMLK
jgi:hypothetical protein